MLSEADHREIERLYARYNFAIDSGDADGWAAVFAPDGVFRASSVLEGREALREFARAKPQRMERDGLHRMQHVNTSILVDGEGDHATGVCYLVLLAQETPEGAPVVRKMGMYEDELVRVAGQWLFHSRAVDFSFGVAPY